MAQDYTQNVIFTPKDALPTTDPNKPVSYTHLTLPTR